MTMNVTEAIASIDRAMTGGYALDREAVLALRDFARDTLRDRETSTPNLGEKVEAEEELDALPVGTVIVDSAADRMTRTAPGRAGAGWEGPGGVTYVSLPATVVELATAGA